MIRLSGAMIAVLALALSACGGGNEKGDLDKLDSKLGGKGNADPALTMALEDQIMVDPQLAQQSNDKSVRPPNEPFQAPIPPDNSAAPPEPGQTLGAIAAEQAKAAKDKFQGCSLDVNYSLGWSNRLPLDLPLFPKAQVSEAAGSDAQGCALRAVTFTAPVPAATLSDFYQTLAKRAGYRAAMSSEGQGTMVSGWRPSDGAAFYVVLQSAGAGTSADLVSNRGR